MHCFLQQTLEALKQLSTFYTENTLQARRNLRSQIEKRSLSINENFLTAFRNVKESFDVIYNDIIDMGKFVQEMSDCLQNAKQQIKPLIAHTASLQENK